MYLASCFTISARRHAHSLLSLMRVPSSFRNGSGSLPLAMSAEYSASVPVTGHLALGSSSLPQLIAPGLPPGLPPPALAPPPALDPPLLVEPPVLEPPVLEPAVPVAPPALEP